MSLKTSQDCGETAVNKHLFYFTRFVNVHLASSCFLISLSFTKFLQAKAKETGYPTTLHLGRQSCYVPGFSVTGSNAKQREATAVVAMSRFLSNPFPFLLNHATHYFGKTLYCSPCVPYVPISKIRLLQKFTQLILGDFMYMNYVLDEMHLNATNPAKVNDGKDIPSFSEG